MDNPIVNGVPLVLVVLGLVEFVKRFGLAGNRLIIVSALIGCIIFAGYKAALTFPMFGTWYGILVYGITLGISTSGLYDYSKRFMPQEASHDSIKS